MKHLAWFATAATVALAGIEVGAPHVATAQDAALVHMSSDVTYDLRLDRGPINVTWDVTLQNNDPDTAFNSSGVSYYYARWAVPVLRGASVSAAGPGGAPLSVGIIDNEIGPVVGAEVTFGSGLFYGDSYSFTVSYSLANTRTESLLITPFYAYIPAFGAGDASTVRVLIPDDRAWDTDVQAVECEAAAGDVFDCSSSGGLPLAAFVEVSRPDSLRSETGEAHLSPDPIALTVRYFPGEETWATHVLEVSEAALPVLEELFGRPYDLETSMEITERGQLDLLGYEGLFVCASDPCRIGVSPLSDDLTLLHELAHAWTTNAEERWLAEGLAEFMARKAASRLGSLVSYPGQEDLPDPAVFPLDTWERSLLGLDATDEQRSSELSGYERSLRFMQLIERRYGLLAIQEANASLSSSGVDSQDYFDALEEVTKANLDALFLEWVFPASLKSTPAERREVRNLYKLVDELTAQAGLELPSDIEALVDNWNFDSAREELEEAGEALAAYNEASDDVEAGRSVFQRIGLIGKDPDEALSDAANAYNAGRFHETLKQAKDAQDTIDGATTTGLLRLLFALGMPLLVAAIICIALWRRRRRQTAASDDSLAI